MHRHRGQQFAAALQLLCLGAFASEGGRTLPVKLMAQQTWPKSLSGGFADTMHLEAAAEKAADSEAGAMGVSLLERLTTRLIASGSVAHQAEAENGTHVPWQKKEVAGSEPFAADRVAARTSIKLPVFPSQPAHAGDLKLVDGMVSWRRVRGSCALAATGNCTLDSSCSCTFRGDDNFFKDEKHTNDGGICYACTLECAPEEDYCTADESCGCRNGLTKKTYYTDEGNLCYGCRDPWYKSVDWAAVVFTVLSIVAVIAAFAWVLRRFAAVS